ncbi:MAG: GIY-YIG nuclease family protein [Deltaproteobacteria bacterium]|nr:GIY-YIG nuclease family protein [Deltaproteobacteria bacterium]
MKYVYLLQSIAYPDKRYVGLTGDLKKRLAEHNSGRSPHTSRYTPWKVIVSVRFMKDWV